MIFYVEGGISVKTIGQDKKKTILEVRVCLFSYRYVY